MLYYSQGGGVMDLSETVLQRIADNLDGMLKDLLGEHVRVIRSDFNLLTIENDLVRKLYRVFYVYEGVYLHETHSPALQ
jgi:hypothetical protein